MKRYNKYGKKMFHFFFFFFLQVDQECSKRSRKKLIIRLYGSAPLDNLECRFHTNFHLGILILHIPVIRSVTTITWTNQNRL